MPGPATRRLVGATGIAVALVLAVTVLPSSALTDVVGADPAARGADGYERDATARTRAKVAATSEPDDPTHVHGVDDTHAGGTDDGHGHDHGDPTTKNAVSRSAEVASAAAADPTSDDEAEANAAAAAAQRAQSDPPLTRSAPLSAAQPTAPTNRYNMFSACYGLQSTRSGRWLTGTSRPAFTAGSLAGARPLYFKAARLGSYLLHSPDRQYLRAGLARPSYAATPSSKSVWTVTEPRDGRFVLRVSGRGALTDSASRTATLGQGTQLRLRKRSGCTRVPEISTGVTGSPHAGTTRIQETRGYIDAHTHGMAFEFLGGQVHCGRPWSAYGVATALRDCPDHELTGGKGAAMEALLSGKPSHDPVGWPTFRDWPAPDSLTHEGTYWKWMERSWRGGQRILVNLLVENNKLCELYPLKRNSCDDMDSVRLQAKRMRELQDYVDAQYGGPGRGWYRIVTTPTQARQVVNAGKLAVVMGIETSVPFGCTQKLGVPDLKCSRASIDRQLDEVRRLGVSQMELVNKFDNALSGVAGDEGSTGNLVNSANALETGSPWRMRTCDPNVPEEHDREQSPSVPVDSGDVPAQDALFGAVAAISGVQLPAVPLYPAPEHCNALGLSDLGEHVIRGMAQRHMMFDPDHMSVKARQASLDLTEELGYGGVLSSHSWSTPDAYARIYDQRGFVAPYAGDSNGFVAKWRRHLTWANPGTYWGIGFGADINGLGAQGDPRPDASSNPVTYPFTGIGGVRVGKQVSGKRTYDLNRDGVAHYGLYPDWVEDLRRQAGSAIVKDLARGPEAYLQMWERAYGVRPDACTNGGALTGAQLASRVRVGMSSWATLQAAGQPHRRLGSTFRYCASGGERVEVRFSSRGTVTRVVRGA